MPMCSCCGVGYLDGEQHVCSGRRRTFWSTVVMFAAPILGGFVGMFALTLVVCLASQQSQCGLLGIFGGFPIGALAGGVVAFRAFKRTR
jgi:hypothetical protein